MRKGKKNLISVCIDDDVLTALNNYCDYMGLSRSAGLNSFLKSELVRNEFVSQKNRKTVHEVTKENSPILP